MRHPVLATAAGIAIAVFQVTASAEVDAQWAQDQLKAHGCLMCHAIDTKKVGPAFKDVATTFKGKTPAEVVTEMKSKSQHASVLKKTSDEDLNKMVEWILSLSQ